MIERWWGLGDTLPWKLVLQRVREMRTESREGGHDLPRPSPGGFDPSRQKRKGGSKQEARRWTLWTVAHPDQFKKEEGKDSHHRLFCTWFWEPCCELRVFKKSIYRDFSASPVIETLPSMAEGDSLIPALLTCLTSQKTKTQNRSNIGTHSIKTSKKNYIKI